MEEQLVVFELDSEAYGVDVALVQSILPMQKIIAIPGAPIFVEGVINLRGAVIPVVDLRSRFELRLPSNPENGENGSGRKAVIVIVELEGLKIGLIVDKVTEVIKIPEAAIEPPSSLLAGADTAYLRGIGKLEEQLVILLDLGRVFSLDEQQALALSQ